MQFVIFAGVVLFCMQSEYCGCSCLRISYRFFPLFRRTERSLRFCGKFYKDNTTSETIFKYIVLKFSKNACQTSEHCFVQVDIRVQNGRAEKAELPATFLYIICVKVPLIAYPTVSLI